MYYSFLPFWAFLIECTRCKKQYVQNPLHICFNGHRSDIKNNRTEKLHDVTILVIEKMRRWDSDLRMKRESYWIHHLKSLAPARRSQSGA